MSATTETNGRVAIVTGGSRGIGRETAERLSKDCFAIVVNYAGNQEEADAAVTSITDTDGKAIAVQADVADEKAVAALFDAAEQEFGGIDVVVHARPHCLRARRGAYRHRPLRTRTRGAARSAATE